MKNRITSEAGRLSDQLINTTEYMNCVKIGTSPLMEKFMRAKDVITNANVEFERLLIDPPKPTVTASPHEDMIKQLWNSHEILVQSIEIDNCIKPIVSR